MLLTIRSKMKFIGVVLIALCTVSTGAGLIVSESLSLSLSATGRIDRVMRNHMHADMMHDALRSDVVSVLLAAAEGQTDVMAQSRKDLSEHSTSFREAVRDNEELVTDPTILG
ncbi:MAG: methyl-accepting chemotaxis protein [bacterium]|nr:MAG: methyl-accepting chemotaxis protein [bacterium]